MSKEAVYGQGHGRITPEIDALAQVFSTAIFDKMLDVSITPNIALANAEFEGDLLCGKKVNFLVRDLIDESIFQDVQGNEAPETSVIELCHKEIEICGKKKFRIKLSVDQYRNLLCNGLENVYMDTVEKTIETTLDSIWDTSHLATTIIQASEENTGNNALGLGIDLGSPANPIVISADRSAAADTLEALYADLQLVLQKRNAMSLMGETALILPTQAANRSMPIFRDLNICCGDDNVRIKGQLPKSIYGFDPYQSNRNVLSTIYNGQRIYYIIAMDKYASGFVSELYNFKWREGDDDYFLVGTEVHGSYVVRPDHVAVAVVRFA